MGSMSLKSAMELCAREFEITYLDGSVETIWIRTITSMERHEADDAHAERIRSLRAEYQAGSPKNEALRLHLEPQQASELAQMVIGAEAFELLHRAQRQVPQLIPLDASKYRTEPALAKAEDAHEKLEAERVARVGAVAEDLARSREEQLLKLPKADLVEQALVLLVRNAIYQDASGLGDEYRILYSVRQVDDHQVPYFDSLDEVSALPLTVKELLTEAINQVDRIKPADIKNLPGRFGLGIGPAGSTPGPTVDPLIQDSPAQTSPRTRSRGGRKRSSTGSQ
jgi:hypothetical protein